MGMIISGYPCVGKSTIAGKHKCIDLESSNFKVPRTPHESVECGPQWYELYCKIAVELSKQGYIVFVSSHSVVRDELRKYPDVKKCICYPAVELKEDWIKKMHDRYQAHKLSKDFRAWSRAVDCFDSDIQELIDDCSTGDFRAIPITSMKYDLYKLICFAEISGCISADEVVQMSIFDAPDIDYPYDHTWDI